MGTAVPIALLAVGGIAAAALVVFGLRLFPRAAFALWAAVLFFVPIWVGVNVGFYWSAITVLTIVMIVVNWSVVPLRAADAWVAAFLIVIVGLFGLDTVDLPSLLTGVLEWVIPYIWGRVVLARVSTEWITGTIATLAIIAAGLAIVEFFTVFNPFILIPGSGIVHDTWSTLQERAGVLRAEGAFGHSIALGATLAMSSAFVVAARWRLVFKILGVVVITTATVLTFSRTGLITLVITLVLSAFLIAGVSRRFRISVAVLGVVGAAVIIPIVDTVFGEAGDEAGGSADYRTDLLVLLGQARPFGNPGAWQSLVTGDYYLGYFARSIDNALVLTLLRYGYVPTLLIMAAVVCVVVLALRRSTRSPAALAVAGQLPSLVVVALITQYSSFFWFCVGLAVTWARDAPGVRDSRSADVRPASPEDAGAPMLPERTRPGA